MLHKRLSNLFEDSVVSKQCNAQGRGRRSQNWSYFVDVINVLPLLILKNVEVYGNVRWIKFDLKKFRPDTSTKQVDYKKPEWCLC